MKYLFVIFLSLFALMPIMGPVAVLGATPSASDAPELGENYQLVPCGTSKAGPVSTNRECGWADLLVLISRIMKFLIALSAVLAVLSFSYAGFLYVTAFGEMGKIEQAHGIFSSVITGVIIVLCAWLLVATILKTLCGAGGSSEAECQKFSLLNLSGILTLGSK